MLGNTLADALLMAAEEERAWEAHKASYAHELNLRMIIESQSKKGQTRINAEAVLCKTFIDGFRAAKASKVAMGETPDFPKRNTAGKLAGFLRKVFKS